MRDRDTIRRVLEMESEVPFSEGVYLSGHTSFGIGGPAALFVETGSKEALASIFRMIDAFRLKTLILGGGTNLLVSDWGFDGLVVKVVADRVHVDPERGLLIAEAGAKTSAVVDRAVACGLGGLEFAAGLPGTIGGALAGNAGCFGHTFSERLWRAKVLSPEGEVLEIEDPSWFAFGYRYSHLLQGGYTLLEAAFVLAEEEPEKLRAVADEHVAQRRDRHPQKGVLTAGSFFKNLPPLAPGEPRRAAGRLLDMVGARDLSVGDAAVFEKHANIVINRGSATAKDVLTLTREMARRVRERFDVELVPEVRFIGEE